LRDLDAYPNEMGSFSRMSVDVFARQVRAVYVERPGRATEARQLAAILEAVHGLTEAGVPVAAARADSNEQASTRRKILLGNRRASLIARLAAVALLGVVTTAGLAFAGVSLPEPAKGVAKALGLPNQDGGPEASGQPSDLPANARGDEVTDFIHGAGATERGAEGGCEFGQDVAEIASEGKAEADEPCKDAGEASEAGGGSSQTGEEASAKGRQTAESHSQTGDQTATTRSEAGRETAESHSGAGLQTGENTAEDVPPETPAGPPDSTPGGPPADVPGGRP
jgi:hypothetical protein